jgi:hypothetical protein
MSSIFTPFAWVFGSVGPSLLTKTISETSFPLALVNGASFELVWRSVFSWLVGFVDPLTYSFASFLLSKVFTWAKLFWSEQTNHASGRVTSPPSLNFDDQLHILFQQSVIILFVSLGVPWRF